MILSAINKVISDTFCTIFLTNRVGPLCVIKVNFPFLPGFYETQVPFVAWVVLGWHHTILKALDGAYVYVLHTLDKFMCDGHACIMPKTMEFVWLYLIVVTWVITLDLTVMRLIAKCSRWVEGSYVVSACSYIVEASRIAIKFFVN